MSLRKHFKFSIFMISFMTDSTADLVQLLKSNSKKKQRERRLVWSNSCNTCQQLDKGEGHFYDPSSDNLVWDARIVSTSKWTHFPLKKKVDSFEIRELFGYCAQKCSS